MPFSQGKMVATGPPLQPGPQVRFWLWVQPSVTRHPHRFDTGHSREGLPGTAWTPNPRDGDSGPSPRRGQRRGSGRHQPKRRHRPKRGHPPAASLRAGPAASLSRCPDRHPHSRGRAQSCKWRPAQGQRVPRAVTPARHRGKRRVPADRRRGDSPQAAAAPRGGSPPYRAGVTEPRRGPRTAQPSRAGPDSPAPSPWSRTAASSRGTGSDGKPRPPSDALP